MGAEMETSVLSLVRRFLTDLAASGSEAERLKRQKPDRLPHDIAAGLAKAWLRFPVQEMTRTVPLSA